MLSKLIERVAQNLRKPTGGLFGAYIRLSLTLSNKDLSKIAVQLLQIKPHQTVLEVGFGPGVGIKEVLNSGLRDGPGKMYGVDFSTPICENVKRKFEQDILSGKLTILNEDVAKMSIPAETFDKVFHINSHLYWPDMDTACAELYRSMKSGGTMTTVFHIDRIKKFKNSGYLKYALNINPEIYMNGLRKSGFVDIEMNDAGKHFGNFRRAQISCMKP